MGLGHGPKIIRPIDVDKLHEAAQGFSYAHHVCGTEIRHDSDTSDRYAITAAVEKQKPRLTIHC